jgi:integrase
MANRTSKLELDAIIKGKIPKRYPLQDGLYFTIKKSGAMSFGIRYQINGKTDYKGMGGYDKVHNNLGIARAKCEAYRVQIRKGINPKIEEQQEFDLKQSAKVLADQLKDNTFAKLAFDTYEQKRAGWTNEKHNKQWIKTLETYAFPIMGDLPIAEISTDHVLAVLNPIWNDKPETADRVRGRIEAVITRADALGLRTEKNPAQWRGHLSGLLTSATKVKEAKAPKDERHHPALPHEQLPDFMVALSNQGGMGARALEVCILCATRTTETLQATWKEIDLDKGSWVIPSRRMKGKKEHTIPLSDEAIGKLKILIEMRASEYVFPNLSSGKHLSQAGMSSVLKRMNKSNDWQDEQERNISVHGFRSTFRDYIADKTTFDGAMAEHALAHKISDASMAAYQRNTMVEKRGVMMQDYANYAYSNLDKPRDNVSQLRA